MTADEVAARLRLPESEVRSILDESNRVIRERWFQTAEYRASIFAEPDFDPRKFAGR